MAVRRYIKLFGDSFTHNRYQAILEMLKKALEHHKQTGEQIGFNVLGSQHPEAMTNLLPASGDDRSASDSSEMLEQIRCVLTDEEIQTKYGVYDVAYNFDDEIEPRFDYYIVPVPVGRAGVDLTSFLPITEKAQ